MSDAADSSAPCHRYVPIMITPCTTRDVRRICEVINAAAAVYEGVIPSDCWREPYMSLEELRAEIEEGVNFVGYSSEKELVAVMGVQAVRDVRLIRHAYVHPDHQGRGIGGALLAHILPGGDRVVMVGTWSAATWAIAFYERHGFSLVSPTDCRELLERYWSVSARQVRASSVLMLRSP